MTKTDRRWDGFAALAAAAAIGLTACSGTSAPRVASLGTSGGDAPVSTTTTVPARNATQLLDEWASCMRNHGDPGQVDPTVNVNKVIQVTLAAGYADGLRGERGVCGTYLSAAQSALEGGTLPASSSGTTGLKFAQCMRANGIPDYPDPTAKNQAIRVSSASDLDPASPTFQAASALCTKRTGYLNKFSPGAPQPGSINVSMAGGFGK